MTNPRRELLLQIHAAVRAGSFGGGREAGTPAEVSLLHALGTHARRVGLPAQRLQTEPVAHPGRLAVHIAHSLEFAAPGLMLWSGGLERLGEDGPAQHLALAAARLLAGREELLLLAATWDGHAGPPADGDTDALVDGDTCARIAMAGLDVDRAFANARCHAALRAAGDLLAADSVPSSGGSALASAQPLRAGSTEGTAVRGYVVVGLKASGALAARWNLARGPSRPPML